MKNIEKIGKVILDYSFYSGKDLYSDGQIEEELLDLVVNHSEEELEDIIKQKNNWVHLYHFSQIRQNIVSWIPFEKTDKILEIGSGCGAITGELARKGAYVDCVELSRKRSLINANRNREYDGIKIKVGNFEEIEPYLDKDYDVITLIGVWEYASLYLSSNNPFHYFLQLLKKHLSPKGKVIIAIENQYGLKYWAGCKEDHTGLLFEGLEGYTKTNGAKTFGKKQLENIFNEEGYNYRFYYPYPDYKLPLQIFSDQYLPEKDSLNDNNKNLDSDRIVLFNENKVYSSLLDNNMFPFFSNSFLIILKQKNIEETKEVIYSKYFNERQEEFRIRADVIKNINNDLFLSYKALDCKAEQYISDIEKAGNILKKNCESIPVYVNLCLKKGDQIVFRNYKKINLQKQIQNLFLEGKKNEGINLIKELCELIKGMGRFLFKESEEFKNVFGNCSLNNVPAIYGSALNFLFKNFNYNGKEFELMNYEWFFDFLVPINYVLFRMIHYLSCESINKQELYSILDINEKEQKIFLKMEKHFISEYIYKDKILLSNSKINKSKILIDNESIQKIPKSKNLKVYYDYGQGFSEKDVKKYPYYLDKKIVINIPIDSNIINVRIDPMEESGIIKISQLLFVAANNNISSLNYTTNGINISSDEILFNHTDPWICLQGLNRKNGEISLIFEVDILSLDIAKKLANKISNKVVKIIKKVIKK